MKPYSILAALALVAVCVPAGASAQVLAWREVAVPHGGSFSGLVETAPGRVLAATDGTLYRSEDAGATWRPTGLPPVRRLRLDAGEVLAVSASGLFRSGDGGVRWRRTPAPDLLYDLRRSRTGRLFAVSATHVFASYDDGASWQTLLQRASNRIRPVLGLSPDEWPVVVTGRVLSDSLQVYSPSGWGAHPIARLSDRFWFDALESPDGGVFFATGMGVFRWREATGLVRVRALYARSLGLHRGRMLVGAADGIYGVEGDTGRVAATPALVRAVGGGHDLWAATDWYVNGSLRTTIAPPDGAYRVHPAGQLEWLPVGRAVEEVDVATVLNGQVYALADGLWRLNPATEQWTRPAFPSSLADPAVEVFEWPLGLVPLPRTNALLLVSGRGDEGGPPLYRFDVALARWQALQRDGRAEYGRLQGVTPQERILLRAGAYGDGPSLRCDPDGGWTCTSVARGGSVLGAADGYLYAADYAGGVSIVLRSDDDGRTWQPTGGRLPQPPSHSTLARMTARGDLVRWTISFSDPSWTDVLRSGDEGRTWTDSVRLEGTAVRRMEVGADGRLVAISYDSTQPLYLSDDGRTWRRSEAPRYAAHSVVLGANDDLFAFGAGTDGRVWRAPWLSATGVDARTEAPCCLRIAPNPFRNALTATVILPAPADVRAEVFDALGRRVALLHDGPAAPGTLALRWAAGDAAPGVYVLRVQQGDAVQTARLVRLR